MLARSMTLCTLALAGTALADPEQVSRWAEEGKVRAEAMRGLPFLQDVPVEFMTRSEIEDAILDMVEEQMPPEWQLRVDRGYKAFGLVPMDSDVAVSG